MLDGAAGNDTVSYAFASAGVTVSLASAGAQATGGSGSDTLISIENLIGSGFNDSLTGNAGNNVHRWRRRVGFSERSHGRRHDARRRWHRLLCRRPRR